MRFLAAGVVCLVLLLAPAHAPALTAQAAQGLPALGPVGSEAGTGANPRTDGLTVVWEAYGNVAPGTDAPGDIYGAPLGSGLAFPIAVGPPDQRAPDIDDGIVVWQEAAAGCAHDCQYDIRGRNLDTGADLDIAVSDADERSPVIAGGVVVWVSREAPDGRQQLLLRDAHTMDPPIILATMPSPRWEIDRPVLDGHQVAWVERERDEGGTLLSWRLLMRPLEAEAAVVVTQGSDALGPTAYDVRGPIAVYATREHVGPRVHLLDLRTGKRRDFEQPGAGPVTDGRFVFWSRPQAAPPSPQPRADLVGYDVQTDSRFVVAPAVPGSPIAANAERGAVAWQNGGDIYAVPLTGLLPTAPQPAGATPGYFPETRHGLDHGFRSAWEQGGGLAVFGYPLTAEFDRRPPGAGEWLTVQYVERFRLERHPEQAGTPYEIQLGLLGVESALQRGLTINVAFRPLEPGAPPAGEACTYIPATRHSVCDDFRAYWEGHGLEFGDPGVSTRESLALFGYPISEAFTDPATGETVQYFERAVLERHQVEGVTTVQLRRLGAEQLDQWGWTKPVVPTPPSSGNV